ncbi:nucleoside/nucleotide kinase family protein [Micromonospora sp. NBC_01699]|uniref:nucleoside/nucleotide kinase family protein n=1 Tax=Micromonospora sp. NBC_01699 TaxID=2975984 RepID=UPI002E291D6D|nr:nucleoside/nucleotide kinase family protein [Micromonospora sp. NBC_01699]
MAVPAQPYTFDQLVARARALVVAGPRRLLGITGAPGAGKSTLAGRLVAALGPTAALVPMDGFHLAEAELHRLGRHARKGAIDTFDGAGFVALAHRLRTVVDTTVYAPEFRRDLEESIAGAIGVPPEVRLVVTEGNYLLVPTAPWGELRGLLDEVWFLDLDARERLRRLTERHVGFGRAATEAAARARGTDQVNADLIETTALRSDLVVRLSE